VQKVFMPSEYVKQKVIKRFGLRNVTVTPNGVNHSLFHPGAKQTRFDLPENYVLFVGTLEPRKNLGRLLHAWNEVKDDFKEMWLMIAGVSGNVFKTIHVSHDWERVRFLGYVDDETLAGLYAKASLFVLPSQDEGFGLPVLEAMASGAPVIVSDGGALPEVVEDAGMIFKLAWHSPERGPEQCEGAPAATTESRRSAAQMLTSTCTTPVLAYGARGCKCRHSQHDLIPLTNVMKECLSNSSLRAELRRKGLERANRFSWQTTAEIVWKSLHDL
jgi:glycosyltransferase involved in cell wall biosynthesis